MVFDYCSKENLISISLWNPVMLLLSRGLGIRIRCKDARPILVAVVVIIA